MSGERVGVRDDKGRPFMYVNIGHVGGAAVILVTVALAYGALSSHQTEEDERIARVEKQMETITASVGSIDRNVSYLAGQLRGNQRGGDITQPDGSMKQGDAVQPDARLPPG